MQPIRRGHKQKQTLSSLNTTFITWLRNGQSKIKCFFFEVHNSCLEEKNKLKLNYFEKIS